MKDFAVFVASALMMIGIVLAYLTLYVLSFAIPVVIVVFVLRWLGVL
jgi:hypothetical protein